jgi:hypothetical protein
MSRRLRAPIVVAILLAIAAAGALPYVDALAFIARAADLPGTPATLAGWREDDFARSDVFDVATRHGIVPARLYRPQGATRRAVTLVPGVHMDGIDETRLVGMAEDLARTGYTVLTVAPPNLKRFRIAPENTDIIEDAAAWLATQPALAPDGRVGMLGISFSGGLSVVAAGRPALHERVAFVMSFGGHGDLPRVMRYLCSGATLPPGQPLTIPSSVEGAEHLGVHPPHDYGVAVVLLTLADRVVPPEQVEPLRRGIMIFLTASSLTLVDMARAEQEFARAREYATVLPEPARTLMTHVNNRAVGELGPLLLPKVDDIGTDAASPALSPERSEAPRAPVFLLHGVDDNVIPASETVLLASYLQSRTEVHALLSGLITHAEVNRSASSSEVWRLASFWRQLMRH